MQRTFEVRWLTLPCLGLGVTTVSFGRCLRLGRLGELVRAVVGRSSTLPCVDLGRAWPAPSGPSVGAWWRVEGDVLDLRVDSPDR